MNLSGGGVLPESVASMHDVDLAGPFVLQVDEIVNTSCPLRDRYQAAPPGLKRCLKLSMTDGVQRVFGMEYRPIKDLEVLAPAGLKVVISNVNVRRGLLMLVPEVFDVLGGMVETLEAARQRVVYEVNKPPRGKRTLNGELPSLADRAALAALHTDCGSVVSNVTSSTSQGTNPFQGDGGGGVPNTSNNSTSGTFPVQRSGIVANNSNNSTSQGTHTFDDGGITTSNPTSHDTYPLEFHQGAASVTDTRVTEEVTVSISREQPDNNPPNNQVPNYEEVHIIDEAEPPFILSGDKETPFNYLASLSAKWAAIKEKEPCVSGIIKCFLTGVKGFQYKQRTKYDLRVYVDDGSLISEIVIDHTVVEKGIGHSPEEVTAALSSSDRKRATDMKETLKQFQIFLVNFEGIMLVEINKAFPLPVALQMDQGCPPCDGWLLLRRLKSSISTQALPLERLDLIDVSP